MCTCSTSSGLEDNVLADQLVYYKSINQVFAGWDFGLYKEKAARIKKSLIRLEITVSLYIILMIASGLEYPSVITLYKMQKTCIEVRSGYLL